MEEIRHLARMEQMKADNDTNQCDSGGERNGKLRGMRRSTD